MLSPLLKGLAIKIRSGPLSNHLSKQKDSLLSLPSTHFTHFLKTSSPFRIADQVVEQDLNDRALDDLLKEQYFWERTLAQREEGSV